MHISFVGIGGAAPHQDMFFHWLNLLSAENLELQYVSSSGPGVNSSSKLLRYLKRAYRIRRAVVPNSVDVLVIASFANVIPAVLGLLKKKVPLLVYISQDWIDRGEHPILWTMERYLARRADIVVWNEHHRAHRARHDYGLMRYPIVAPTYLPRAFPVPERDEALRTSLLNRAKAGGGEVSRLVFAGGPFSIARRSRELLTSVTQASMPLAVVFTGQRPSDCQASNDLLQKAVFVGKLSFTDVLRHCAACDFGALLYDTRESFGNRNQQPGRLTEFLRTGVPCVASPFSDAEKIESETGYISCVDSGNPASIAEGFMRLIARQKERGPMNADIRKYAIDHFAYDEGGGRLLQEICQFKTSLAPGVSRCI